MRREPDSLDLELRDLPKVRASAGFTGRVLRRMEEPDPVLPSARLLWAGVGASLALVSLLAVLPDGRPNRTPSLGAEATEIRRQHALLSQELDRLRSRTEAVAPVLYLGSDDEIDYVLDLSPFLLPQTAGMMPASSGDTSSTF